MFRKRIMTASPTKLSGFTLIELMLVIAVMGIAMAIAVPAYQGYVESSKQGVMRNNIETLRLFQEEYRLENREYIDGTYDPADPGAAGGLKATTGWDPGADEKITYTVSAATATGFIVEATDPESLSLKLQCDLKKCVVIN